MTKPLSIDPGVRTSTEPEPQHTPGPWTTVRDNFVSYKLVPLKQSGCRVVWAEHKFDVAYCPPTDDDNGNANARLIAAAPELLAACKLGVHVIDLTLEAGETKPSESWAGILQTMRAAIAKAKP